MEEWNQATKDKQPAFCYYVNNYENGLKYGKLYNWYAVTDPRGIAPEGFRKQLPLQHLGVKGCYRLFNLFHFKTISNRTNFLDNGALLDEMIFEHAVDKQNISIFSYKIKYEN